MFRYEKMNTVMINAAVVGSAVIVSVALLEVLIRVTSPGWLDHRMKVLSPGERLGFGSDSGFTIESFENGSFWRFTPFSQFEVYHYEYSTTANIDDVGGRNTNEPRLYARLIPFYGDSFTFGVGVDDDDTFVSKLVDTSDSTRFVNLGVPGSALHQHLDNLEARHQELETPEKYIFFLFLGNDLTDVASKYLRRATAIVKEDAMQTVSNKSFLGRINFWVYHNNFLNKSYLIQYVRQKMLSLYNQSDSSQAIDPFFLLTADSGEYLEMVIDFFSLELERIQTLSISLNFDFLFVLLPSVYQVDENRWELGKEYYNLSQVDAFLPNKALSGLFSQFNIRFIDTTNCMRNSDSSSNFYYIQDNHFTRAGHNQTAKCIAPDLKEFVSKK